MGDGVFELLPIVKQDKQDRQCKHEVEPRQRAPGRGLVAIEVPGLIGSCKQENESEDYVNPFLSNMLDLGLSIHTILEITR